MSKRVGSGVVTLVAVGILVLAGCASNGSLGSSVFKGGGGEAPTAVTPSSGGSLGSGGGTGGGTAADFCSALSNWEDDAENLGGEDSLPDARADFQTFLDDTKKLVSSAPAAIRATIPTLVSDTQALNTFIQTKATLDQINNGDVPSSLRSTYRDFSTRADTVDRYYQENCPQAGGSGGSGFGSGGSSGGSDFGSGGSGGSDFGSGGSGGSGGSDFGSGGGSSAPNQS
jgi:hypothetical protein